MTEAEWLACVFPTPMLAYLRGKASVRKLQLFACAAARQVRVGERNESYRGGIEAVERFADGGSLADCREELTDISCDLVGYFYDRPRQDAPPFVMVGSLVTPHTVVTSLVAMQVVSRIFAPQHGIVVEVVAENGSWVGYSDVLYRIIPIPAPDSSRYHHASVANLLRDILGPMPFRPVTTDPSWLTSTALALARQMYDTRDFSPMPTLADALQDAGCDHPDILAHCRSSGPHVRGCWVVDLVLGKA